MNWMIGDYRYANSRLSGSIVRTEEGEPVFVFDVLSSSLCTLEVLLTGKNMDYDFKKLNIDPVPLGFCNTAPFCTFLKRMPLRRDWRQGLRQRSLRSNRDFSIGNNHIILSRTITGSYPRISAILDLLDDGDTRIIAFARNWAIGKVGPSETRYLYYKDLGKVGHIKKKNNSFRLNTSKRYLKESLLEIIGEENE